MLLEIGACKLLTIRTRRIERRVPRMLWSVVLSVCRCRRRRLRSRRCLIFWRQQIWRGLILWSRHFAQLLWIYVALLVDIVVRIHAVILLPVAAHLRILIHVVLIRLVDLTQVLLKGLLIELVLVKLLLLEGIFKGCRRVEFPTGKRFLY